VTNPQPPSPRSDPIEGSTLARVSVRGWQSAYRGVVPDAYLDALDVEERLERWRERPEDGVRAFVVEQHGIAGYCSIDPPAEVASLYVLPERRRAGIGSALLAAGLDELRARGGEAATLWVFKANHAARAFCARFGLIADGTEGEGTGVDEIRLRVEL
jgi:GNAT superfamily N-acetyltransferase